MLNLCYNGARFDGRKTKGQRPKGLQKPFYNLSSTHKPTRWEISLVP